MKKIKRALISVYDKKKLKNLLKILKKNRVQILSSGGTYKEIKKLGFKTIEISNYTKSQEVLDGRVKTLNPKIHAGILMKRNNAKHKKEAIKNNFREIDLVVVNFYPFKKALEKTNNHKEILENIENLDKLIEIRLIFQRLRNDLKAKKELLKFGAVMTI